MDSLALMNLMQRRAALRQQKRATDMVRSKHIKALFQVLETEHDDPELLRNAKIVVKECSLRRKSGDPKFANLIDSMEILLRELVGEKIWEQAMSRLYSTNTGSSLLNKSAGPIAPKLRPVSPPTDGGANSPLLTPLGSQPRSMIPTAGRALRTSIIRNLLRQLEYSRSLHLLSEATVIIELACQRHGLAMPPSDLSLLLEDIEGPLKQLAGAELWKEVSDETVRSLFRSATIPTVESSLSLTGLETSALLRGF